MKKGFTLIELLAVIVILAIILAIAVPSIASIIKKTTASAFESDAKMVLQAVKYKQLENPSFDYNSISLENMQSTIDVDGSKYKQVIFEKEGSELKIILVGDKKWNGLTAYGTIKNMRVVNSTDYDVTPPVITMLGDNPTNVYQGSTYNDVGAIATDTNDGSIAISSVVIRNSENQIVASVDTSILTTYTITYTVSDKAGNTVTSTRTINIIEGLYSYSKGVNKPVLATGMTPIKWDGTSWVTTTATDDDWYNYTTTDKKWANAKTADGSMWVWIPRYVYKISSGWHTATTGTIDVQFSIGIDDTRSGTVTLDTGTTSNASNGTWTNHPTFTFGTTELPGIWVSKFEASGTTSAINSLPNVHPLLNLNVDSLFTASRNMEVNSRYGWGTTGSGIDTHMMKNTEWGAAAYLAKSTYGKSSEIAINNNSSYITGYGNGYAYDTTQGALASTTGNIYGIYDMSGGVWEYVSAYVNNGNTNLTTYGSSAINADTKYKDVYTKGTTDDQTNNYNVAINKKGDAIYETSSAGIPTYSWYGDQSYMVVTTNSFFLRGGRFTDSTLCGSFSYSAYTGQAYSDGGFRPVLLVGTGL
jgi:prepilin-type N-terminal cleavage/methylation domain-containing protein